MGLFFEGLLFVHQLFGFLTLFDPSMYDCSPFSVSSGIYCELTLTLRIVGLQKTQ